MIPTPETRMRRHVTIVALVNLLHSIAGLLAALGLLVGGVFAAFISFDPFAFLVGTVLSVVAAGVIGLASGGLTYGTGYAESKAALEGSAQPLAGLSLVKWLKQRSVGRYPLIELNHLAVKQLRKNNLAVEKTRPVLIRNSKSIAKPPRGGEK